MKSRHPFFLSFTVYCLLFTVIGCGPTYPKSRIKESIIKVCRNEYKIDVKVATAGKTVAIYLPLENLLDFTFAITKEASEKINDVILSVSRVTLSTDAKFDFYCIIAHDIRIPEIQIVIIKSVDDVKRFLLNDISRGDYSKRMIIDIRLSPQAQKERAIKEIFSKINLDPKWQEQVLNDFFRSEPTALNDIGYWNSRFYIKDITLAEFLAEQIANRIRIEFRENKKLIDIFLIRSSKASYISRGGKSIFRLEVLIEQKELGELEAEKVSNKIFETVLKMTSQVLRGYKFEDFDYVEVSDQKVGRTLEVSRKELDDFRKGRLKIEEVLK